MAVNAQTAGYVYLIHLARPLGNPANAYAQARHYCGWTYDVEARLALHRAGQGARLLAAAVARGIAFDVVRVWPAPLGFEKQVKACKSGPRLCPVCCAEHGWACRHIQPLNGTEADDDFPAAPRVGIDGYEIAVERTWRATRGAGQPVDWSGADLPW